jgi:ferrous iron transport protein B
MRTEEISAPPAVESELAIVALIGNPNSGKTTLFNALTGLRQKIANYPGVTVEKKIGVFMTQHGREAQMIDLPGTYSLTPQSPDEAVTRDVLLGVLPDTPRPDRVVCVVDAANLERNLYLACQVIELGVPTIVALNMFDLAKANGDTIDVDELSRRLGVPVIPCSANTRAGIADLRIALSTPAATPPDWKVPLPPLVDQSLETIRGELPPNQDLSFAQIRAMLILLLSDERAERIVVGLGWEHMLHRFRQARASLIEKLPTWQEDAISARYDYIGEICQQVLRRGADAADAPVNFTDRIDAILIHPVWGWLIFLSIMGLMFTSIFTFANYPMDGIKWLFAMTGDWVKTVMAPGDLRSLITDGVIKGVGGVVVFLPQILILFLFIGLLEDSGYMARAAFIMDRVMSGVGLHGKSFIPLLSSYACAIPGIMATRTIENPKDRLATILVAPFMSCSARLPVYALMIATLFPADDVPAWEKAGLLMGMYALGTLTAFAFAWLFKRTILRGRPLPLVLELPPYRRPSLRTVAQGMVDRANAFVRRAGTVILGLSIILWALAYYPKSGVGKADDQLAQSYAGRMGKFIEPALEPLGLNWKIGIGLIGAQAAREVFVSTVAVVYSVGASDEKSEVETDSVRKALLEDKWPDGRAVFTPLVCLTIMIYFVFSMQCISTLAVVRRETNTWRWPVFVFVYMTGFAYVAALAFYQVGLRYFS